MSVGRLQNEMRKQALLALGSAGRPRLGLVTDFDPTAWAAKVAIQPEGYETGWLPVMSPWVGNGWGMFSAPSQNDQVLVLYQEGHVEAGLILGGFFSDQDRPLQAPAGECWLVHQSGAYVKLTNDGQIASAGTWVHSGSFSATGEVTAKSGGAAVALSTHKHGLTGGPETSAPLPS